MILYVDSSSMVKLYIEEDGSPVMRQLRNEGQNTFTTSRIAYAEVRAAFARRWREGRFGGMLDANDVKYRLATGDFDRDWRGEFLKVAVSEGMVRLAGDLAERHALRGFDAVHLASAVMLYRKAPAVTWFSGWDSFLAHTARTEGLSLAHEAGS